MSLMLYAGLVPLFVARVGGGSMAVPSQVHQVPEPPALLGVWVLNRQQSDDPHQKLRELEENARRNRPRMGGDDGMGGFGGMGGRGPGGMGGMGGMGGPGGPHGGRQGRGAMGEPMRRIIDPQDRMTITHRDGDLVFDYADGHQFDVTADGKKIHDMIDEVEIKAKWKGDHLVVERKFDVGTTLVEDYFVAPESGQLFILVEFDSRRMGKVEWRWVYDRAPAESSG